MKRIHLIGIGGAGMCGVARVLAQKGYYVTGSDIAYSDTIQCLLNLGIKIFFNHCSTHVHRAHIVVISSAVSTDNPEIQEAKRLKIPIMARAEMLSELIKYKYGIAVSGTHGKTTTTAILIDIYIEAGLSPTFINGGIIKSLGVQSNLGCGHYCIVEADESDQSLLFLYPKAEIITNIDSDHINNYYKSFNYLKKTFIRFIHNLPTYGYVVMCIDDPTIQSILHKINRRVVTYGFKENAKFRILNYFQCMEKSNFTILIKNNKELKVVLKSAPGRHNVLNATAAIAVAIEENISEISLLKAVRNFKGIKRRFENLGNFILKKINGRSGKVMLIDDYGHHPTEVCAAIMTVRSGWPDKRLIMVFQPHRFTRTRELFNDFVEALSYVDVLLVLDIYSAGEKPIVGINSQSLCSAISKFGKIKPLFIPNNQTLFQALIYFMQDNDLILIQGAGTIGRIVRSLFINNYLLKKYAVENDF